MTLASTTPPLCRYCGKPIAKKTRQVWLQEKPGLWERHPTSNFGRHLLAHAETIAECQALADWRVVSVSYYDPGPQELARGGRRRVHSFSEWDGESYADPYFCTGGHAIKYAAVMAKAGHVTVAYTHARKAQKTEVPS